MDFSDEYVKKVLKLKKQPDTNENIRVVRESLIQSHRKIYKAVAFDIDGTLTLEGATHIDVQMSQVIKSLLLKGVHVILISGRGRGSMRDAVKQMVISTDIPISYLRRLSCIAHNGITWLRTTSLNEANVLKDECNLVEVPFSKIKELKERIAGLEHSKSNANIGIVITDEPNDKPFTIRIKYSNELYERHPKKYQEYCNELQETIASYATGSNPLYVTFSKYGKDYLVNVSNTNKTLALKYVAKKIGINEEAILRVGDQGDKHGNDYELLNCNSGFSVGSISDKLDGCFPVLKSPPNMHHLKNADATHTLLGRVMLFPPLSLEPAYDPEQLKSLFEFEALAIKRARYEVKLFSEKMKIRLHRLLDSKDEFFDIHLFQLSDLFDLHTGGVVIKPHEIFGSSSLPACRELFGIKDQLFFESQKPQLKWSMFTDTNLLMRGPNYYWGLTQPKDELMSIPRIQEYINMGIEFLYKSTMAINELAKVKPSLLSFKFYLAIIDNARNIALNLLYTSYGLAVSGDHLLRNESDIDKFYTAVSSISLLFYDALFNESKSWIELLRQHIKNLKSLPGELEAFSKKISTIGLIPLKGFIRKWREADFFFENVISVNLGLHEFINEGQLDHTTKKAPITAVGIVYGGIELPFIAHIMGKAYNLEVRVGLINISLYSSKTDRKSSIKIESLDDFTSEGDELKTLIEFPNAAKQEISGRQFLLLDDNCTTCRTLDQARNSFVKQNAAVLGAIVVKFPGTNRYAQMLFPEHGIPDPYVLLSFIRGFVTPTPYTRIFEKNAAADNQYLDENNIFDKAKNRVLNYLRKNGDSVFD